MNIQNVKRVFFWGAYLLFLIVMMLFMVSSRITFFFRVMVTLFLAFFSAYYRFENKYSFLPIVVVLFAASVTGFVLAASMAQFLIFTFVFVMAFFCAAEVLDRGLLNI